MKLLSLPIVFAALCIPAALVAQAPSDTEHINPGAIHKPSGYSHVVVVPQGPTVYIAGQVPLDKDGKMVGTGDFAAQVRQAFENLREALKSAGCDFGDVVSLTTYVTDISQLDTYRKVRSEYLHDPLPSSTLVEVKGLFRPGVMIEMSAIAARRK
jgi:enamine deaminase RidA (YjgF/YER057c/UK114 family)